MKAQTVTVLILLPLQYNPDKKGKRRQIPAKHFSDTAVEISKLFGLGCTVDAYPKYGIWVKLGIVYKDVNVIIEIDNFPKAKEPELISYCKSKLLKRFKQKSILIKFVPEIQAILVSKK